ncbi:MAG TPA: TIGR00282 family metallophosphoesterase [Candidatus Babeliales bacterium]|jgi:hypothetical protein|nr:TIGR00282 family metallophosphoesterase [Candidatus Babeliales bacterium]
MKNIRILCIGDVIGAAGRAIFQKYIPKLKKERAIDLVVVNGENSAHDGRGIIPRIVQSLRHNGADVVTSGNHIWAKKEIYAYLDEHTDLIRPLNFPHGVPGAGYTIINTTRGSVAVANLQGRVFMKELVSCPFRAADSMLTYLKSKTAVIIIDFHAETTAEKSALAQYLDGRVSVVYGTHTHIQTADEQILPKGTAFITDVGMAGSLHSIIGMKKESIIRNFLLQMPSKFEVDTALPLIMGGIIVDIDPDTGRAISIERIRIQDNELIVTPENTTNK